MSKKKGGKGSSSVIKPGTGSGSRPKGGSTHTPTSEPMDKKSMSRKGKPS
jgi:hypothetical protein